MDAPNETPDINFTLEKGGSITGRVVDAQGDPIRSVGICVQSSNFNWGDCRETDSEGYYEVVGLPTGDYYVRTYNEGLFIDQWYQDADPYDANPPPAPVHVDAPNETPGIDFTLEKGGSITGRVVDEKGNPINWVYVYAYDQ